VVWALVSVVPVSGMDRTRSKIRIQQTSTTQNRHSPGNDRHICEWGQNVDDSTSPHHCARGASQCLALLVRTMSHRNHRNLTGSHCTTHLHNFRRSCLPTCSKLEQVQGWEVLSSGPVAVLESVEVLESVQLLSAPELARQAEP